MQSSLSYAKRGHFGTSCRELIGSFTSLSHYRGKICHSSNKRGLGTSPFTYDISHKKGELKGQYRTQYLVNASFYESNACYAGLYMIYLAVFLSMVVIPLDVVLSFSIAH